MTQNELTPEEIKQLVPEMFEDRFSVVGDWIHTPDETGSTSIRCLMGWAQARKENENLRAAREAMNMLMNRDTIALDHLHCDSDLGVSTSLAWTDLIPVIEALKENE